MLPRQSSLRASRLAVAKSVAYVGHNADGSNMFVSLTPGAKEENDFYVS
jgi:hypothetical protein